MKSKFFRHGQGFYVMLRDRTVGAQVVAHVLRRLCCDLPLDNLLIATSFSVIGADCMRLRVG